MDDITIQQASSILVKPPQEWTRDENHFIWKLIKAGHRDALKALRNQVQLGE